jgi:hypothetical protein
MPTESKLDGKTFRVINTLAATLAQATLKSSAAEKVLIGKEFDRAFEILSKHLAEVHSKAVPKQKQELEKLSQTLVANIIDHAPAPCCVGYPSATTLEECAENGGSWACITREIEEP